MEELKRGTIGRKEANNLEVSADSFLLFLDKLSTLTHSSQLNEVIMKSVAEINIDMLNTKQLLNTFQRHSTELKFEEKIRMGEIKKFAKGVIPKSRFIFDRYEVGGADEANELAPLSDSE